MRSIFRMSFDDLPEPVQGMQFQKGDSEYVERIFIKLYQK